MTSRLVLSAAVLATCCALARAQDPMTGVNVPDGQLPICPMDDCYLTYVDANLCGFLHAKFKQDSGATDDTLYNCIKDSDAKDACLNVIAPRRHSEERQEYYTEPNLTQLMQAYLAQLNQCLLPEWEQDFALIEARQERIFRRQGNSVTLSLTPMSKDGVAADRLTLKLAKSQAD